MNIKISNTSFNVFFFIALLIAMIFSFKQISFHSLKTSTLQLKIIDVVIDKKDLSSIPLLMEFSDVYEFIGDKCISSFSQCTNSIINLNSHFKKNKFQVNDNYFSKFDAGNKSYIIHYKYVSRSIEFYLLIFFFIIIGFSWIHRFRYVDYHLLRPIQNKNIELKNKEKIFNLASRLSHDIRSPITVLEQIKEYQEDGDIKDLFSLSLERLNSIVDSQLKSNKTIYEDKAVDFNYSSSISKIIFESKTIFPDFEFQIEVEERRTLQLKQNIIEFERSISNLIKNSIDASNSIKKIKINAYVVENSLVCKVADYGCGISEENISKIVNGGFSTKSRGNGIGLSSTIKWIAQIEGEYNITSKENMGTEIMLVIPVIIP